MPVAGPVVANVTNSSETIIWRVWSLVHVLAPTFFVPDSVVFARTTVFGFSLFGRVGVNPGISQWYRVGDAGALRAEPLATLMSCAVKKRILSNLVPIRCW